MLELEGLQLAEKVRDLSEGWVKVGRARVAMTMSS